MLNDGSLGEGVLYVSLAGVADVSVSRGQASRCFCCCLCRNNCTILFAARLIKNPEEHDIRLTWKLAEVQRGWRNSEGLHELQRGAVPRVCALQQGKLRHAGLRHTHCLALVSCLPSRSCNLLKKKTRGYTSCCSPQLQPFPGARTGRNLAWEPNIPPAGPGC